MSHGRETRQEEESLDYAESKRGSNIPMVGGISQREFEEIAIVFDSIRGLCGQFQPQKDAELEKEYEEHLAHSLEDIQKEPQNRKKSLLVGPTLSTLGKALILRSMCQALLELPNLERCECGSCLLKFTELNESHFCRAAYYSWRQCGCLTSSLE